MNNIENKIDNSKPKKDGCKPSAFSELLCCPFCGGIAELGFDPPERERPGTYSVGCEDCLAYLYGDTELIVRTKWNRRAT
jgi:hypothetical protein